MKTQGQIVANTVKSLHVQQVIANKGWSEQHAQAQRIDDTDCILSGRPWYVGA